MAAAAEVAAQRGVLAMVGFTYRRVPAIALARQLVAEGRIGTVRHVRAQYLQDWIADEQAPLSWRLDRSKAGSGALGDIGAHIIDLTQFVTGQSITGVAGLTETFVKERPLPGGSAPSGTYARSTCRTGSSIRLFRWCGGCRRTRPGRERSVTSARTSSTWRNICSMTASRACLR